MTQPQYPSLGDITKALFDHAGILPQKNDSSGVIFDDQTKRSIQAQLRRLAKEESKLEENLQQLLALLANFIEQATGSSRIKFASMYSVSDLFTQYRDFIRGDSTFYTKKESIKWLIENRLLDRIILSYQKNTLKFNVSALCLTSPSERYWWLPDIHGGAIQWPLAKAMSWMYRTTDTNQTRFHFPNSGTSDDYRLSQNLENASRWSTGSHLPSWWSLLQNLNDSKTAMEQAESPLHQRTVDKHTMASFRIILFIARFSTSIFIELNRQFGTKFVVDIVNQIKKQDHRLAKVHSHFENVISTEMKACNIQAPVHVDQIWFNETQAFWEQRALEIEYGSKYIQSLYMEKRKTGFSRKELKLFLRYLDSSTLSSFLRQAKVNVLTQAPPAYFDLLYKGLSLRKESDKSKDSIQQYVKEIQIANLDSHFLWLINWIWATYHYRRKEDHLAFPFYLKAFESGKYSAGHNQYLLVNQFLESCAKNSKWRDFKKGVAWANYLGIKVRWYRGIDESDNRLKTAYEYLKIGRYAQV